MRPFQELVEQTELVHDLQRGRVDGVAAKVAQKVRVLLEHDDVDARACQQIPQHHPGGTAAGDAASHAHLAHRSSLTRSAVRPLPDLAASDFRRLVRVFAPTGA
jgi:hypothetical protein